MGLSPSSPSHLRFPLPKIRQGLEGLSSPGLTWSIFVSQIPVAAFANLAGVVAGSVALGYGVADIPSLSYYPERFDYICKPDSHRPWWATPTPSPAYDWRVEECKRTLADFSVSSWIALGPTRGPGGSECAGPVPTLELFLGCGLRKNSRASSPVSLLFCLTRPLQGGTMWRIRPF